MERGTRVSTLARTVASASEFTFTTRHQVYYSTREAVPVADIVDALLGLDRLVKMTPKALSALTGVEILKAEVFVEEIESGSLRFMALLRCRR